MRKNIKQRQSVLIWGLGVILGVLVLAGLNTDSASAGSCYGNAKSYAVDYNFQTGTSFTWHARNNPSYCNDLNMVLQNPTGDCFQYRVKLYHHVSYFNPYTQQEYYAGPSSTPFRTTDYHWFCSTGYWKVLTFNVPDGAWFVIEFDRDPVSPLWVAH